MLTKFDIQLIRKLFEEELLGARRLLTDDILMFKDEIVGELQKLRDEVTIVTGYKDQIENHEDRIEKIEGSLGLHS